QEGPVWLGKRWVRLALNQGPPGPRLLLPVSYFMADELVAIRLAGPVPCRAEKEVRSHRECLGAQSSRQSRRPVSLMNAQSRNGRAEPRFRAAPGMPVQPATHRGEDGEKAGGRPLRFRV